MTELPAPLSAPDCYLGGYDFMPLLGTRLFASEFYGLALKNPRAGLAAMKLWWLAYSEQRPAGSLPGSEDDLCRMADLGTDLKAWRTIKSVALHGFVQCSDGRYYHPVICKEAAVAYAARVAERDRKAKWRAKQQAKAAENNEESEPEPQECPAGQDGDRTRTGRGQDGDGTRMSPLTGQDRTGQDSKKEEREERKEVGIEAHGAKTMPPAEHVAALRARPPTKGCRLPDDWNPGKEGREFAVSIGISDPEQTFAKFRDHWHAKDKDATKRDWFAAWRMWCRKELEWQPAQTRGSTAHKQQPERTQIRNPFLSMLVTDGLAANEHPEDRPIFPELSDARH